MRYVLLLQGEKASAFAMGRAEFGAAVVFNNDSSGHVKFSQYLAERHNSLFSVVLDSKDEEHHLDSIPLLKRGDRRRILEKISARHFPDGTLSTIRVEHNQRQTSNTCPVTVSGMPFKNDCQVWLKLLDTSSTLMTDISSLSLLGLAIHRVSGSPMSLIAIQVAQNDFRLMAYHHTRLIISRHLTVTDNLAVELTDQLRQTQDYIQRLPMVTEMHIRSAEPQDSQQESAQQIIDGVQVIGAVTADSRAELERTGVTVISCRAMSRLLGIKPEVSVPFADMLFAALALNRKSKRARFSMAGYKNHFLARRLRHMLYAGSIACLGMTAAATAAAVHYNGTYTSLIAATTVLSEESGMSERVKSAAHSGTDIPIDAIRDSMRIAEQLNAQTQFTPLHFLASLATDLTVYPELEVTAIQWSQSQDNYNQTGSKMNQYTAVGNSGAYYNATVTGFLQIQPLKRVEALGRFNSFVAALTATGQYVSVIVVDAPFNAADGSNQTGSKQASAIDPSLKESFVIELTTQQEIQ